MTTKFRTKNYGNPRLFPPRDAGGVEEAIRRRIGEIEDSAGALERVQEIAENNTRLLTALYVALDDADLLTEKTLAAITPHGWEVAK